MREAVPISPGIFNALVSSRTYILSVRSHIEPVAPAKSSYDVTGLDDPHQHIITDEMAPHRPA